ENRKLIYVGAKGVAINYEVSEITLRGDTNNVIDTVNVVASGTFTEQDSEGYSIHQLSKPVLLQRNKIYIMTANYGETNKASYIRTKSTGYENIGHDPHEDEAILTLGQNSVSTS